MQDKKRILAVGGVAGGASCAARNIDTEVPTLALAPRPQPLCFACGVDHPHGLKLQFRTNGSGSVVADWTPSRVWEGFQGIIHGGIVSTVLDEAMSKAVAAAGAPALTCHLEVRLRRHVAAGEPMRVHGWVVEKRKRRVQVEAELRDKADVERAHAWATFLEVHAGSDSLPRARRAPLPEVQCGVITNARRNRDG